MPRVGIQLESPKIGPLCLCFLKVPYVILWATGVEILRILCLLEILPFLTRGCELWKLMGWHHCGLPGFLGSPNIGFS